MQRIIGSMLFSVIVSSGWIAQSQPRPTTMQPVNAMVEALRQAAPKTNNPNDGLYSDWQVKAETARGWSKQCIGRELTPSQFESSPVTVKAIITCVVQSEFGTMLRANPKNEMQAVRNMACWWMTGQTNGCSSGPTASYVQQVSRHYQKLRP